MHRYSLEADLQSYARASDEKTLSSDFQAFLNSRGNVFERANTLGHFTGSAWLVSMDGARALLMHHRKLGRWLQPGGHADGDRNLARVALREAQEETGLTHLTVVPEIFDLDRHRIPKRGDEPAHWHYDVRYVVRTEGSEVFICNDESLALAWRPIREIADDVSLDDSLRRMAHKWLSRRAVSD